MTKANIGTERQTDPERERKREIARLHACKFKKHADCFGQVSTLVIQKDEVLRTRPKA